MPLPSLPLRNGILEIDNSFLEALTTCPRSLQYAYLQRRVSAAERTPLSFGTAIHAALEYRYKHIGNSCPTPLDEQEILDEVLLPHFTANPTPDGDHRTCSLALELIKKYNQRYPLEPFQLMTDKDNNIMTELSFSVPLTTTLIGGNQIPVNYVGRIDLPVLWDGHIIIIDHKTTSSIGARYADTQKVSPQFEGYCWAFQQSTGLKPLGFCINVIRSQEPPARPRNGIDAWWDESFLRHKEYLRPNQLDEWKNNVLHHIDEFIWHYERGYMSQKKKACTMYGKCQFYEVCYLPEANREQYLASTMFRDNDWSPLKG